MITQELMNLFESIPSRTSAVSKIKENLELDEIQIYNGVTKSIVIFGLSKKIL